MVQELAESTKEAKVFGVHFTKVIQRDGKIPKFIFDAIEYIEKHGLSKEGLFRINGNLTTKS